MTSPVEQGRTPERGHVLWIDPADLVRDNPAANIVNSETYRRMSINFDPEFFDFPQVARVITYSSEGNEAIRIFVIDGHTRTKYAYDHRGDTSVPNWRFDRIPVRDVTGASLHDPNVVPEEERQEGRDALTMIQYLRAVVPPTVEHSLIAPDRIAGHLINAWGNIVGEELANKFSAVAALSLLEDPRVPTATNALFNRFLNSQNELMTGETQMQRIKLQQGLFQMASIIRETKLPRGKVLESAFILVASESPVIGGEKEAARQVHGILQTPEVEKKLNATFSLQAEREQSRLQLGKIIFDAFRRFSNAPNREAIINKVFGEALKDPSLSLNQATEVFASPTPAERYNAIKQGINLDKLRISYQTSQRRKELSSTELQLIERLGKRTNLSDRELPGIVRAIQNAVRALEKANGYRDELASKQNELLNTGVSLQTITRAIATLDQERDAFLSTTPSLQRTNELLRKLSQEKEKIDKEINIHKVGVEVDQVYGEELIRREFGTQIRLSMIYYILRETDPSNETIVREKLNQLKALGNDLQQEVISGMVRLHVAERIQNNRRTARVRPTVREIPPEETVIVSPPPVEAPKPTPPRSGVEDAQMTREAVERRRKEVNNAKLRQIYQQLGRVYDELDLEKDEMEPETERIGYEGMRKEGRFWFTHPDMPRVMKTDYPRLLKEDIAGKEARVQQDQRDAETDTGTRI